MIKRSILMGLILVILLVSLLSAGCGKDSSNSAPPIPMPPVDGVDGDEVIEKTVPELVLELKDNPDKYKQGTIIRASGTIVGFATGRSQSYYHLGPPHQGFYVIVAPLILLRFVDANVNLGDEITVEGGYDGFHEVGGCTGPVLDSAELITKY